MIAPCEIDSAGWLICLVGSRILIQSETIRIVVRSKNAAIMKSGNSCHGVAIHVVCVVRLMGMEGRRVAMGREIASVDGRGYGVI